MRKRLTIGLLGLTTLISCSDKYTPLPEITAKGQFFDSYVYELKVNRKSQGFSIHNLSWDKYEAVEKRWIYIDKNNGRVDGQNVKISIIEEHKEFSHFSGYIEVDSLSMTINLHQPTDNKGKDDWEDYKFNGTFKIVYTVKGKN